MAALKIVHLDCMQYWTNQRTTFVVKKAVQAIDLTLKYSEFSQIWRFFPVIKRGIVLVKTVLCYIIIWEEITFGFLNMKANKNKSIFLDTRFWTIQTKVFCLCLFAWNYRQSSVFHCVCLVNIEIVPVGYILLFPAVW